MRKRHAKAPATRGLLLYGLMLWLPLSLSVAAALWGLQHLNASALPGLYQRISHQAEAHFRGHIESRLQAQIDQCSTLIVAKALAGQNGHARKL